MIIHCDQCQKAYKIDPAKLKHNPANFRCKACGKTVSISVPLDDDPTEPAAHLESNVAAAAENSSANGSNGGGNAEPAVAETVAQEQTPAMETDSSETASPTVTPTVAAAAKKVSGRRRLGVSGKMLLLFFLAPIILMVLASGMSIYQLKNLSLRIASDSNHIVERLSHQMVDDHARMVAAQCKLYLESHPELTRENFERNLEFRNMAVQKVGETGYTCIYSIPDYFGKSSVWVHPNENIIGIDLPSAMKKPLGDQYAKWWRIYQGAYDGKATSGYYTWKEKDGSLREKYMTCAPVEGTPFIVAATTYVDEITRDVQRLETTGHQMTQKAMTVVLSIFTATLILMGSTVLIYSRRLSHRLKTLIYAAERISVGELNTQIQIQSRDEIKDLADAIGRMQESIRLSIERLRKRR